MWGSSQNSQLPNKKQDKSGGLSETFQPENFIPGLVIGFIIGLFLDLSTKPSKGSVTKKNFLPGKTQHQNLDSSNGDKELKMVLVVRQDLKMGTGKIASQCAHASTGMYSELMQRLVLTVALLYCGFLV
ncbi:Peptidyl-tRNA hydrolase 2, mitochondrial [Linum grandiflorum]